MGQVFCFDEQVVSNEGESSLVSQGDIMEFYIIIASLALNIVLFISWQVQKDVCKRMYERLQIYRRGLNYILLTEANDEPLTRITEMQARITEMQAVAKVAMRDGDKAR